MNSITINNKTFTVPDGNISVVGDKIYVNGQLIEDFENYKVKDIKIVIDGDVNGNIECGSADVKIKGNVHNVKTGSGDIEISGNVSGDVTSGSGDITCSNINGSVKTGSGDIIGKSFINKIFR